MTTPEQREANRLYKAQWRKNNPAGVARERAQHAAMTRALWRLAKLLPNEFAALTAEEMAKGEEQAS
jgi:hypothetical protein